MKKLICAAFIGVFSNVSIADANRVDLATKALGADTFNLNTLNYCKDNGLSDDIKPVLIAFSNRNKEILDQ